LNQRRSERTSIAAFAAMLLMFVQSIAGTFSPEKSFVPLDIFGNPLCVTGAGDHGGGSKDHGGGTGCCMLGCGSVQFAATAPGDAVALDLRPLSGSPVEPSWTGHRPDQPRAYGPGSARAPPSSV